MLWITTSRISALAEKGRLRMEWAEMAMPVSQLIRQRFEKEKPLEGLRFSACLHVTTETAVLMRTLAGRRGAGGALRVQPVEHAG